MGSPFSTPFLTFDVKYYLPTNPTYWPTSRTKLPDILDFYITAGFSHIPTPVKTLLDLSSDHSPVLLHFNLNSFDYLFPKKPNLLSGRVNWEQFKQNLDISLNISHTLRTPSDIDDAVNYLTTTIQSSIWNSSIHKDLPRRNTSIKDKLPTHIKELLREKRRTRKIWQLTRCPSHKQKLNRLTRQLTSALNEQRNNAFKDYRKKLTLVIHFGQQPKGSSPTKDCPTLSVGKITPGPSLTLKTFAQPLSRVFQPHHDVRRS